MHKILLYLILLVGLPQYLLGQTNAPSLPEEVNRAMEGSFFEKDKINYLLGIVKQEQYKNPALAKAAANEAYFRSNAGGGEALEAEASYWLSWLEFQHNMDGYYMPAANFVTFSINLYRNLNDPMGLSRSLALRSALALDSRDTVTAQTTLQEAEKIVPQIKHRPIDSMWVLGYVYLVKSGLDEKERLNLQLKSLKLFEQTGDSIRIGRSCMKLSGVLGQLEEFEKAIQFTQRAANAYKSAQFDLGEREAYVRYIEILINKYIVHPSDALFNQTHASILLDSAAFPQDHQLLKRMGDLYSIKAYHLNEQKKDKQAQICNDTALLYFNKAWEILKHTQNYSELYDLYLAQQYACKVKGDCNTTNMEAAAGFLEMLKANNKEMLRLQMALTSKYNADRQRTLQQERGRLYWAIGGSLLLLLIVVMTFRLMMQRRDIRNMNRELNSRMEALRAQMNPHFISNCLNAIESLVNQNRNKEASHYIIQFSRLCRVILNNSRNEYVTLDEELSMLRYFMNLEQLRMGERLQYKMDIDPGLNQEAIVLPPMILQPFVENAIWHGIIPKSGPGTVTIKAQKMDDRFYKCIIEDDGIGRKRSAELRAQMVVARPSLGLAITEERIEKLYKLRGSQIETADLTNPDGSPAGTRITITLPIQNLTEKKQ